MGRTAAALSGIHGTDQNYECAIKTAKERFVRQDALVQEHLTELLNVHTVEALDDVNALRSLYDNVYRNIARLKNFGFEPDTYDAIPCASLFHVLPTEWAVEFNKTHATDKDVLDSSTLEAILGSFRLGLNSRENIHASNPQGPHQTAKSHLPKDKQPDYLRRKSSATAIHHLAGTFADLPDTINVLKKCHYIDDQITGHDTVQEVMTFQEKAQRTLSSAEMNLKMQSSNSDTVQQ